MYCQFARSSFECGIFVRRKNNIISIGRNTDRTGENCCDDLRIFPVGFYIKSSSQSFYIHSCRFYNKWFLLILSYFEICFAYQ